MVLKDISLLQALISARGLSGQEDEVRTLCEKELKALTADTWIDPAGNVVGKISGTDASLESIQIHVHMDELSLIVKRINEDGSLRVNPLGGILPANYGQGPVDILGDKKVCLGILSFGCMHTTKETPNINKITPKDYRGLGEAPNWEDVKIVTRMSADELRGAGIHPGTRVVIAASRRQLYPFQDCIAGYFLDNHRCLSGRDSRLRQKN